MGEKRLEVEGGHSILTAGGKWSIGISVGDFKKPRSTSKNIGKWNGGRLE
jgi:hypothetical protein